MTTAKTTRKLHENSPDKRSPASQIAWSTVRHDRRRSIWKDRGDPVSDSDWRAVRRGHRGWRGCWADWLVIRRTRGDRAGTADRFGLKYDRVAERRRVVLGIAVAWERHVHVRRGRVRDRDRQHRQDHPDHPVREVEVDGRHA